MLPIKTFKVRDLRNKNFFMLDDAYLNGYARLFDTTTTCVYLSLCRHADKDQSCFPSQELIAKEHNINPRTVRRKINNLIKHNLITVEQNHSGQGKWLNNTYVLLDKEEWKTKTVGHQCPSVHRRTPVSKNVGHPCPIKETHTKETHTLSPLTPQKYSKLEELSDVDFKEIAEKYQVPLAFVRSKYDDMLLWAGGKINNVKARGRNWRLTLMKWVKDDSIKIRKERSFNDRKRGIDATEIAGKLGR